MKLTAYPNFYNTKLSIANIEIIVYVAHHNAPVDQLDRSSDYESGG